MTQKKRRKSAATMSRGMNAIAASSRSRTVSSQKSGLRASSSVTLRFPSNSSATRVLPKISPIVSPDCSLEVEAGCVDATCDATCCEGAAFAGSDTACRNARGLNAKTIPRKSEGNIVLQPHTKQIHARNTNARTCFIGSRSFVLSELLARNRIVERQDAKTPRRQDAKENFLLG